MLKKVINRLKGAVRKGGKRACMIAAGAMLLAACAAVDGVIAGCDVIAFQQRWVTDWRPGQKKVFYDTESFTYNTSLTTCAYIKPNEDLSANDGSFMVTVQVMDGSEGVSEYVSMGRCDYGPKRMKYTKNAPYAKLVSLSCSYSKYSRFGMNMFVEWHIVCRQV